MQKAPEAFLTIGELAGRIGVKAHILRYWEEQFPMLRPLTRAGGRRLYRPADVALVERIHDLLTRQGYTIRGARSLLQSDGASEAPVATPTFFESPVLSSVASGPDLAFARDELLRIRDRLASALAEG